MMVSKALVVGAYQRKAEEIARLGVDLTVLVPPSWHDRRGSQIATAYHTQGYQLKIIPIRFNGNFHLHHYPTLPAELKRLNPDLLHMDEEPYNIATWLGLRAAKRWGILSTFFTWQNLYRPYPPPFRWLERDNYNNTPIAMAGNQEAAAVLRRKGYGGEISIIPQFGIDPQIFQPPSDRRSLAQPIKANDHPTLQIGYAGGFLPEKAIDILIHACAKLRGRWQLHLVGEGPALSKLKELAAALEIGTQVHFRERLPSTQMAEFYQGLDIFVLPSRTMPNWKEQFGRVLIEAMACEVVVVGSDSGEIPNVIGEAGLIFPENSEENLAAHLQRLIDEPEKRRTLARAGRMRVLENYTMAQVAQRSVELYERLLVLGKN